MLSERIFVGEDSLCHQSTPVTVVFSSVPGLLVLSKTLTANAPSRPTPSRPTPPTRKRPTQCPALERLLLSHVAVQRTDRSDQTRLKARKLLLTTLNVRIQK